EQKLKLKQRLTKGTYSAPAQLSAGLEQEVKLELHVLQLEFADAPEKIEVTYDLTMTQELQDMVKARETIISVQAARKELGCELDALVEVTLPDWPDSQAQEIKRQTLATQLIKGEDLKVKVVS